MSRRKPILIGAAVLVVVISLTWAGMRFLPQQNAQTAEAQTRTTTGTVTATPASYTQDYTVKKGDITASISPVGQVYAPHSVSLSFEASGVEITELNAKAGQTVQAGAILAKVNTSSLQGAVDKARSSFLTAEDALTTAKEPATEVAKLQAQAAQVQAKTSLEAARDKLADLLAPDLTTMQKAVSDAQTSLKSAQDKLASLKSDNKTTQTQLENLQWQANEAEAYHGQQVSHLNTANPSEEQLDYELLTRNKMLDAQEALQRFTLQAKIDMFKAEHDVVAAQDTLANAIQTLAEAKAGPTATTLTSAQNAVAQGEYDVLKTDQDLKDLLAGPDQDKVKLAQSRYDAAKATYDDAVAALKSATMVAPFAGTVVSVNAAVGDLVSPNLVIFTLADLTELRILASIDETQITGVAVGQPVAITLDALPGKKLQGQILEVPLDGKLSNNVVTFSVDIALTKTDGAALKPGMTANLVITTGSKKSVLIVPTMGVATNSQGTLVTVRESATSKTTSQVPVEIGIKNGSYTEIVRGLNEGDIVVITYKAQSTTQNQRGFDGGPPPGAAGGSTSNSNQNQRTGN